MPRFMNREWQCVPLPPNEGPLTEEEQHENVRKSAVITMVNEIMEACQTPVELGGPCRNCMFECARVLLGAQIRGPSTPQNQTSNGR